MSKIAPISLQQPRATNAALSRDPWLLFPKTSSAPGLIAQSNALNRVKSKLSGLTAPTRIDASASTAKIDTVKSLLGHVCAGEVHLRIPLQPDAKLSILRTRPDTYVDIRVVIDPATPGSSKGTINFDKTRLEFRQINDDGETVLSSLNGPLCLDPQAVFINGRGKLKVKTRGLPNIGVTKLATGARKLPQNLDDLISLLQQRGGRKSERGSISLAEIIDVDKIRIDGSVSLTGPVTLGSTLLDLNPSTVELHGTPSHLRARVDGDVRSATFSTKGARVRLGAGHIGAELEIDNTSGRPSYSVAVSNINVEEMSLQAGPDKTTLTIANPSMSGQDGAPLLALVGGTQPALSVTLDTGLDALASLPGQSGLPLSTILGTDGNLFQARVMLDSQSQKLRLETRIRTNAIIDNLPIANLRSMQVDLDSQALVELRQVGTHLRGRGQVAVASADIRLSYGSNGPELSDIAAPTSFSSSKIHEHATTRDRHSPTSPLELRPFDAAVLDKFNHEVEPDPNGTFAAKFPALTNTLEEMIGAVGSGTVQVTLPLREFHIDKMAFEKDLTQRARIFGKDIEDRMGIEIQTKSDYLSGQMAIDLVFDKGALVPGKTSIRFEPPIVIEAHVALWGPGRTEGDTRLTATIDGLVLLQAQEDGQGMFWPNITFDGKVPQSLAAISHFTTRNSFALDHLAKSVGIRELTHSLFGQKTVPLDVDDFVAALSLEERLKTAKPHKMVRTIVDWKHASMNVAGLKLDNRSIPLGDGQFIDIAKGSRLNVSGSANDLVIEGTVDISSARLGDDNLAMSLRNATARLRMHRSVDPVTGTPTMTVTLDGVDVDQLDIEEPNGDSCASLQKLTNASLRFERIGDAKPELNLSTTHAKMVLGGSWKGEAATTETTHAQATVAGTLSLKDGALDCIFNRFELDADVGVLTSGSDTPYRNKLSIRGATHCILKGNEIELCKLDKNEAPLTIENIEMVLPDGSFFQGRNGTGQRLKMTTTEPFQFALWGMSGEINLVTGLNSNQVDGAAPQLDLRHARLHMAKAAAICVDNGKFYTRGSLEVHDLDASVMSLVADTGKTSLNLHQVDIKGSASLTMSPDQVLRVDALDNVDLTAEFTTDLNLVMDDPNMSLDLCNVQGGAKLIGLRIPIKGPIGVELQDLRVTGEFVSGCMLLPGDDSERRFHLDPTEPGNVQMYFPILATGIPFTGGNFEAKGTVELQSSIHEDVSTRLYTGNMAADFQLRADIETKDGHTSAGIRIWANGTADVNIDRDLDQPIKKLSLTSK
ncbi:MAG: hypothetical protein A2289_17500 [Deltaproteobacteria bacterium RIFOXYA12_FULL_58_15]|nr:MAG: hypothetical protein A2289_17500 [Deltaproteobacteria bacterium RIFOXYA12_FULL_58_15]